MDQLVLLVAGFLLTTVVGGVLGYFFQERAWKKRYSAEQRTELHRQAAQVFQELSTLMDRRLYRMRQLWWAIKRSMEDESQDQRFPEVHRDYRLVLYEWNDNLNRALALVTANFGKGARASLEGVVFEEFASIGRALDYGARLMTESPDAWRDIPRVGGRLTALSHRIYRLNLRMLKALQNDELGDRAVTSREANEVAPLLAFGAQSNSVRRLQKQLNRLGYEVPVDAVFGPLTHKAVLSVQRRHGLQADGIVGPGTSRYLPELSP